MVASEKPQDIWELSEQDCHVSLTHNHLNYQTVVDSVRSPSAGAIVVFAGKAS